MLSTPDGPDSPLWVVRAGLIHRTCALPISLLLVFGKPGSVTVPVILVAALLLTGNVWLVVIAYRGPVDQLHHPGQVLAADLAVVLALNLWLSWQLPTATLAQPPGQVFHLYTLGTVVVWTALLGWRAGAVVVAAFAVILPVMVAVNGVGITLTSATTLCGRVAMLGAAILVPHLVVTLSRRARSLTLDEAQQWAAERSRNEVLYTIHDTVLQSFGQLARLCVKSELTPSERCREVSRVADAEYAELTRQPRLSAAGPACPSAELRFIAKDFEGRGLDVTVTAEQLPKLERTEFLALAGAVREALTNVLRHAGVGVAAITAEPRRGGIRVTVTDMGRGFDAAGTPENFGLRSSIQNRIKEVGGTAIIASAVGHGTEVQLWVPAGRAGRRLGRGDRGTRPDATAEELANRALGWFVVPALVYRVVIRVILAVIVFASLGSELSRVFLVAMGIVVGVDLVILAGALLNRFQAKLRSRIFLTLDIVTATALNLWSAFVLPVDMIVEPDKQVFWGYGIALVAFWTAMRGNMVGGVLVVGGLVAQVGMVLVNGSTWTIHAVLSVCGQVGILAMTLAVVGVMTTHARRDAHGVIDFGLRTGCEFEQSRVLREAQESAIKTLERVQYIAGTCTDTDEDRLRAIRGLALAQSDRLRATLPADRDGEAPRFIVELRKLKEEFRGHGLRVELVTAELGDTEPPSLRRQALIAVVRGALNRVRAQAGIGHVVVRAGATDDGIEIVIRDQGPGIDPQAEQDVHEHLTRYLHVDGELRVWSRPGRGCRVTVRSPLSEPVPARR